MTDAGVFRPASRLDIRPRRRGAVPRRRRPCASAPPAVGRRVVVVKLRAAPLVAEPVGLGHGLNRSRPAALHILRQAIPPRLGILSSSAHGTFLKSSAVSYPWILSSCRTKRGMFKSESFVTIPASDQDFARRAIWRILHLSGGNRSPRCLGRSPNWVFPPVEPGKSFPSFICIK